MLIAGVMIVTMNGAAQQQGRLGGRFVRGPRLPGNPSYDGAFTFCRIMFRNSPYGDGGGWFVDYPRADLNLSFRLAELTTTLISKTGSGRD